MPKFTSLRQTPEQEAMQELKQTAAPSTTVAIPLEDVTAPVTEVNQPLVIANAQKAAEPFTKDTILEAEQDDLQRTFVQSVLRERQVNAVKEYTPPAVPDAVKRQTELEMEAGRKTVAAHAERAAANPRPQQSNESMVPVFRPDDYVPNQRKGQGTVPHTTARSTAV